eukprot:Nk52_evm4s2284 gene=Nk52_evmTU4s2284
MTLSQVHENYGTGVIVRGNYPFTKLINVAHYLGKENPDYNSKVESEESKSYYVPALQNFPGTYGPYSLNTNTKPEDEIKRTEFYKAKNFQDFDFLPTKQLDEVYHKAKNPFIIQRNAVRLTYPPPPQTKPKHNSKKSRKKPSGLLWKKLREPLKPNRDDENLDELIESIERDPQGGG